MPRISQQNRTGTRNGAAREACAVIRSGGIGKGVYKPLHTEAKTVTAPSVGSGALFALCTRRTRLSDGSIRIRCVRGLWSVDGKDRNFVRREAMHYWQQYHADGEYAAVLANVVQADDDKKSDVRSSWHGGYATSIGLLELGKLHVWNKQEDDATL